MFEGKTVDAPELADWLGITPRRIQQLVQEGVLERVSRGRYPLKKCVKAYVAYQDDQIMRTGASGELSREKLLTAQLERKRKELEFERLQGTLITVADHEEAMAKAFTVVRTNLRSLPGAVAPRLAGLDDARDVQAVLLPAIDGAMRSIVEAGKALASDELPDDIPHRTVLEGNGIQTMADLLAVRDLTELRGIGPARAVHIEKWRRAV